MAIDTCKALGIEDGLLDGCIYDIAVTNDTSFAEQETLQLGKNCFMAHRSIIPDIRVDYSLTRWQRYIALPQVQLTKNIL